jgi:hypothetical protein
MEQGMTKQLFDDNTMTTIEAPKRFWAENWDGTEYVRADNVISRDEAEAMVRKAVEAERERCARVADTLSEKWWDEYKNRLYPNGGSSHCEGMSDGAADIASAIREEPTS